MITTHLTTAVVLISMLFSLLACSSNEQKKVKHYQSALEYIKVSEDKAAIIELKNAIKVDAKFADARYQLGLLYLKNENHKAAFGQLQRVVGLDSGNLDAGVKVAEFYLLANNLKESRNYVEQVLSINPDYLDGLALLANLELVEGNFMKADHAVERGRQLAPDNDKFYNIKGRVLAAQNKLDEAEQVFKKAIELNPNSFANHKALLNHYDRKKDATSVQDILSTMATRFPENPQIQLMIASFHERKGEFDMAETALLQAISMEKGSPLLRLSLVEFYKKQALYEKAEIFLKSSLLDFPSDLQIQVELAELQFDMQKFEDAQISIAAILKNNPANGGANLIKARFQIKEGQNNEAIQTITPLTTDYPKWADPFYYLAFAQLRIGKTELAQKSINTALQVSSVNDLYHALAAQIYLARGNGADASKEASIALTINPENFLAVKILAQSLVREGAFEKAVKLIEALNTKFVTTDPELLGTAGLAYLGLNNIDKAKEAFATLLTITPDNTRALSLLTSLKFGDDLKGGIAFVKSYLAEHDAGGHYILLGDLYIKNQQLDDALQAFENAQNLSPANLQGYLLRANLLRRMGKTDEAITQFTELLKIEPNSVDALFGLAAVYESLGRLAEAKEKYLQVLVLQPNLPSAANNLAWLLTSEENGDLGEALRLAMQAKQELPNQPHIADTLGWVHYKRNAFDLAISQFKQALEMNPNNPTISYHLALAQYSNDQKSEAIALLKQQVLFDESQFPKRDEAQAVLSTWVNQ